MPQWKIGDRIVVIIVNLAKVESHPELEEESRINIESGT